MPKLSSPSLRTESICLSSHGVAVFVRRGLRSLGGATLFCALGLAGCGGLGTAVTASSASPVAPTSAPGLGGHVHGGQQPVIGSRVYLYATSTVSTAGPATSLLNGLGYVLSDLNGSFSITGDYTCPKAPAYVYLLALGGNPGLVAVTNTKIAMAAGLGLCSSLTASTSINLDEVTTVATAFSLASYATTETQIGSSSDLAAAFNNIPKLVNVSQGLANASSGNVVVPQATINSLADSIAACINSDGNGSACSTLLTAANVASGTPQDTFQAVLNIAQNPGTNVAAIYNLGPANPVFQPTLGAAPTSWTIAVVDFNGPIGADANTYRFATTQGDIYVELRPDVAPANVANFMYYANNGLYSGSFFHRLISNFVLQGGGYTFVNGQANTIATAPPVVNEATLSNVRGTLSMALTASNPNSATDQFFFNLVNNPSLDNPSSQLQSGGYTVIGQIVGVQGINVDGGYSISLANMDAIGADSVSNLGSPFDSIPLLNYASGSAVGPSNLVYSNITQVTTPAGTVTTPLFSPVSYASAFSSNQLITLSDSTPGAQIYYFIFASPGGGNNPNPNATLYTGPFTLPASTYIVAYATAPGYANQSSYNYEYYSIQ